MKRDTAEGAPLFAQVTYKLNDVTYVPHFRNSDIYVGPGYPRANKERYSAAQLIAAGAMATSNLLWSRGNYGVVTDSNP
jgi:hypothetical protein